MLVSTMHRVSIQITAPDLETFTLPETPSSFASLVHLISQHLSVDPASVRLTYTDPSTEQRLMLVGDQRYSQAIKAAKHGSLLITVVLVPVIEVSSPSERIDSSHSKNQSFEEYSEAAIKRPVPASTTDPEDAKRRVRSMLDNSQHYLSSKFKDALFGLMTAMGQEEGELDLSEGRIGTYESVLVAEVMQVVPGIRRVKLGNNKIGNDGLASICQGLLHLPLLELLDLTNNQLTSKAATSLAPTLRKLSNLHLLMLAGNKLKTDDIDLILDSAPSMCRVVYDKKTDCQLM